MLEEKMKNLVRPAIFEIPPYVPGRSKEEICATFNIAKDKIIKMASNENALGLPDVVRRKLTSSLQEVFLYPESSCEKLLERLAGFWGLTPSNFILGNGCDEVISMLCETFLNPEDEVIIGEPTFSFYEIASKIAGCRCVFVPLTKYKFDLLKISGEINKRTKLIFICNPNNPTGTTVDKRDVEKFLSLLPEHVLVVFDEAYADYVEDKNFPNSIKYIKNNIIVLRTFSKIYSLAGLRIGYGIASREIISFINRVRKPFNINRLAYEAALISLGNKGWINKALKMTSSGKKYLYKELDKLGLFYIPSQANFILIKVGGGEMVFEKLLEKGIIVRPTSSFGLPDFIRVTVGTEEQNKKFIRALKGVLNNYAKR